MMLGQLRDRIQNVQHDLSMSIRDTLTLSSSTKAEVRHRLGITPLTLNLPATDYLTDVNLLAGSDLIDYFQNHWQVLQRASRDNADNVRKISAELSDIDQHICTLRSSATKLVNELVALPELEESLSSIESEINKSLLLFGSLEDVLVEMNQEVASADYQNRKIESEGKIHELVLRRSEDLRLLESQYVAREEAKLREQAERESQLLRERQAVFQKAFEEELCAFKQNKTSSHNPAPKQLTDGYSEVQGDVQQNAQESPDPDQKLAEISLEIAADEVDALEQFLEQ